MPSHHIVLPLRFRQLKPCIRDAVSTLKLYGKSVRYQKIADEIMGVKGVITHGLILDAAKAAVVADGPEAKIIEKVTIL